MFLSLKRWTSTSSAGFFFRIPAERQAMKHSRIVSRIRFTWIRPWTTWFVIRRRFINMAQSEWDPASAASCRGFHPKTHPISTASRRNRWPTRTSQIFSCPLSNWDPVLKTDNERNSSKGLISRDRNPTSYKTWDLNHGKISRDRVMAFIVARKKYPSHEQRRWNAQINKSTTKSETPKLLRFEKWSRFSYYTVWALHAKWLRPSNHSLAHPSFLTSLLLGSYLTLVKIHNAYELNENVHGQNGYNQKTVIYRGV